MNENKRWLFCILGSIIISLTGLPGVYDVFRNCSFWLAQLTDYVSSAGIILTIYFSIRLILENCRPKK